MSYNRDVSFSMESTFNIYIDFEGLVYNNWNNLDKKTGSK
jgi:hypothetical protein